MRAQTQRREVRCRQHSPHGSAGTVGIFLAALLCLNAASFSLCQYVAHNVFLSQEPRPQAQHAASQEQRPAPPTTNWGAPHRPTAQQSAGNNGFSPQYTPKAAFNPALPQSWNPAPPTNPSSFNQPPLIAVPQPHRPAPGLVPGDRSPPNGGQLPPQGNPQGGRPAGGSIVPPSGQNLFGTLWIQDDNVSKFVTASSAYILITPPNVALAMKAATRSQVFIDSPQRSGQYLLVNDPAAIRYLDDLSSYVPPPRGKLGFYDVLEDGTDRPILSDMARGSTLQGMVQFIQTHSTRPSNNDGWEGWNQRPDLIAFRSAVVLFTPQLGSDQVRRVKLRVSLPSDKVFDIDMKHPNELMPSDYSDTQDRPDVAYSLRAWSAVLPWNWVQQSMALRFSDQAARVGHLPVQDITVVAPIEMTISVLKFGMLDHAPRVNKVDQHYMYDNPESAAVDYFNTLPVSRLTVGIYEAAELDEVMTLDGHIYRKGDNVDDPKADWHFGKLQAAAWVQIGNGLGLANGGVTSVRGNAKDKWVHEFNQRVILQMGARYNASTYQVHGALGTMGAGPIQLDESVGNELSHELGHTFRLDHYPGADFTTPHSVAKLRDAAHHSESGWGWIAHRGMLRANLRWHDPVSAESRVNQTPYPLTFAGRYLYNFDTMSGGTIQSDFAKYTHATAYSARRIQQYLLGGSDVSATGPANADRDKIGGWSWADAAGPSWRPRAVPDAEYPSGYRAWDNAARRFVDARTRIPAFAAPRPTKVGVPVFSLFGMYNPEDPQQSFMYPPLRGNAGNVFRGSLPQPDFNQAGGSMCIVQVRFVDGSEWQVPVESGAGLNQFQLNVAEADGPIDAGVSCRYGGQLTSLAQRTFPRNLEPMRPPVVVGQEMGYASVRKQDSVVLGTDLTDMEDETFPVRLSAQNEAILRGWEHDLSGLAPKAREVATRYLQVTRDIGNLTGYLQHRFERRLPAHSQWLEDFLQRTGIPELAVPAGKVLSSESYCLVLDPASLALSMRSAGCERSNAAWIMDARGALHNGERPDLCVVSRARGEPVFAAPCNPTNARQHWSLKHGGFFFAKGGDGSNVLVFDMDNFRPLLGQSNGANGGESQRWTEPAKSDNPLLANLSGHLLKFLIET